MLDWGLGLVCEFPRVRPSGWLANRLWVRPDRPNRPTWPQAGTGTAQAASRENQQFSQAWLPFGL